jgi:6-phospho-beta-glucosidase
MAGLTIQKNTRCYMRTVGLSHGNWTTAIWNGGKNILPEIVNWSQDYINQKPPITAENYILTMQILLTALYGALPSHHMPYYYFPERVLEYIRQQPGSQAEELMARRVTLLKELEQEAQKEKPQIVPIEIYENYDDSALDVLCAILHDTGDEIVLNVPNRGALKFLPEERVAELPCRVDARGATPLTQSEGGLALDQRGLIVQLAEYAGATARTALWGTRIDAIKALTANPLVMSYSRAEALYNDLAAAHAEYLPDHLLR